MAEVHRIKGMPTRVDLDGIAETISKVSGTLGVLAMMAARIDDDEFVIHPREFEGMMEGLRGQLVQAKQALLN